MNKILYFWPFFLFAFQTVYAQETLLSDEHFLDKLDIYKRSIIEDPLFLHIDKTVYTNNETIWFSAYLIEKLLSKPTCEHSTLSVALISNDNHQVALTDKYKIDKGLSAGSLTLPDTIAPGNYRLLAYTNVLKDNGRPTAIFSQALTIKSITQQNFNATLSLLDTVIMNGAVRAKITVSTPEKIKGEYPSIDYVVGEGTPQHITLKENEVIITIPKEQLGQKGSSLRTSIRYNEQTQFLNARLPETSKEKFNIRFFPEGGSLHDGIESSVGWEANPNTFPPYIGVRVY